jgi:V8-like Glu-specific endopeptidase
LPQHLRGLVDAIGLTSNGCTATHVGDGVVLSAGHCVSSQQECAQTTIHWGYLAGRDPSVVSRCTLVLTSDRGLGSDYAVFEVDRIPKAAITPGTLGQVGERGHPVTMLGYPSGAPLHWSACSVQNPPELPGGISRSQASALLFHRCASRRGSSGSPLIDPQTQRLVGIHAATLPPWSIATPFRPDRS